MTAQLHRNQQGGFQVTGDITFATASALFQRSDEIFTGDGNIDLDLNDVSRVDSAGLVLLVEWVRRAAGSDRRVRFVGMSDQLKALIRINGLQTIISGRAE